MTAAQLRQQLNLQPHPEGGYYRQTFRSAIELEAPQGPRAASTAIYFLLEQGDFSAWHRVASDEVWHFYAGDPLELHLIYPDGRYQLHLLGPPTARSEPQVVVPAGVWQAACPVGTFTLAGCTVAPGFDFADFDLPERAWLLGQFPGHQKILERFTRGGQPFQDG